MFIAVSYLREIRW